MAQVVRNAVALAGAVLVGSTVVQSVSGDPSVDIVPTTFVTRVIDGDTVEIASGDHVRLIGINTPERGACGFKAATRAMRRMVEGREVALVNPPGVQDLDEYDRLLRFVEVADRDTGLSQIRSGRAVARYDSLDGYDRHPREVRYHAADGANEGACEERERTRRARWLEARRAAQRADIRVSDGETAVHVLRRARHIFKERKRHRRLVEQSRPKPAYRPGPDREPQSGFVPPAGWTTDALTPGYTGCRQGYPGGAINGVDVWKPIDC